MCFVQATFRELVPLGQQVRRKLASISTLRSAWHLGFALRNELRWRPVTQNKYAKCFAGHTDPWGYEITPFTLEKFQAAIELLDIARNGVRFERAWEIGCAEGVFTARLARYANDSLLSTSYRSPSKERVCGAGSSVISPSVSGT